MRSQFDATAGSATLEDTVRRIQSGEPGLRDSLIEDCLPDIRRSVRRAVRSLALDESDASSIGLEMFNLAIDRYRPETLVPFIRYAQLLIRNRLIDCYHRWEASPKAIPFSDCETPDGTPLEDRLADPRSSRIGEDLESAESLAVLDGQLQNFGFNIDKMVQKFPRHQDTRLFCIRVARQLAGDDTLMARTCERRRLPVSDLAGRCGVPVKTIDKNRASIIFLALLLKSDLTLIQTYLAAFDKEATQ